MPDGGLSPMPTQQPSSHRGRRVASPIALLVVAAVAVLLVLGKTGAVRGLPFGKPSAGDIEGRLQDAGLPIGDGEPRAASFAELVRNNRCADSRGIVRTDGPDTGWALICVGAPKNIRDTLEQKFDGSPALLGPLYADADDRDVIVFGFGWPGDASEQVHDALGDDAGTYIGPDPSS